MGLPGSVGMIAVAVLILFIIEWTGCIAAESCNIAV